MTDGTIISIIGEPALLEQTAEEAIELAHACLKLARKLRAENPTPIKTCDLYEAIMSEWADVDVCITELTGRPWWDDSYVSAVEDFKTKRWRDRLNENSRKGTP
jgi:hypothetical protein